MYARSQPPASRGKSLVRREKVIWRAIKPAESIATIGVIAIWHQTRATRTFASVSLSRVGTQTRHLTSGGWQPERGHLLGVAHENDVANDCQRIGAAEEAGDSHIRRGKNESPR